MSYSPEHLTLPDLLVRARDAGTWLVLPARPRSSDEAERIAFSTILERSQRRARALLARGAEPGRACVLAFDNDVEFVISFFAVQWLGMIAVPHHPPNLAFSAEAYVRRLSFVASHCDAQLVLAKSASLSRFAGHYRGAARLVGVEALEADAHDVVEPCSLPEVSSTAVAVIQYTSGSTGEPKAAELTHAAITANVRGIGEAVQVSRRDSLLCWLPMFHDMGLFGSLIFTLYWRIPIVLMTPRSFLLRPESWLWAIARFSATLCPAPNFAYHMAVSKLSDEAIGGLDLSSWRVAFNGSENVQRTTVEAFIARFQAYGFARSAMYPVYGLAENVLAACFPACGEEPAFDWIDRRALGALDRAVACESGAPHAIAVACVGRPLLGQSVRITREGVVVPDREVGEIELDGPTKLRAYHRAPAATSAVLRPDGWLRSGDLGYVVDGQLYVVGRLKNVIKRGGESFHAEDIESELARLPGVLPGYVAACAQASAATGTDEIVILIEQRERAAVESDALKRAIAHCCRHGHGFVPHRIVLLRPGSLPRTTSGKIRRAACTELLEHGGLDEYEHGPSDRGSASGVVDPTQGVGASRGGARLDGKRAVP